MRSLSGLRYAAAVVALTLGTITCDRGPTSPKSGRAILSLRPQFASSTSSAGSFGLNIDNVRVTVSRGEAPPLKDTTVVFPASATEVDIVLEVPIDESSVDATVSIQLRQQTTIFFSGTQPVTLQAGQSTEPVTIPVVYVGPGQNVAFLSITPSASSVIAPATVTLNAAAFDANEGVVTGVPIDWSVSDATIAAITANGQTATLTPTGKRGSVTVTATTPTGISATSAAIAISPAAARLTVLSGGGQSAIVGSVLAQSFEVRVDAADNLPVQGITVQFQATTTGGSVAPASAVSDVNGLASTSMKLGTITGPYVFQASGTGMSAVTVSATALAGAPASIVATAGALQTAVVGTVLPIAPTVAVKDASGNPASGVAVTFTASATSGSVSTGTTFTTSVAATTDATGAAKVNWKIGALAGPDTLTVSAGTLPPVLFIANGIPGPAALIASLAPLDSTVNPGQTLDAMRVKVTDAGGVNGVDGIPVTFTSLFGACTFTGGATQIAVTTAGGGVASVQPLLSPNATPPSSCAIEATATNGQSVLLTGSPVWYKRYLIDPASTIRIFTGASSTNWSDAKNWWKSAVPATTDVAWIPSASAASHVALLNAATTIASLITEGAGQLDLNKNTLTLTQNFDGSAGGIVTDGTLQLNGDAATATGSVQTAVVVGDPGCTLGSSTVVGAAGFVVTGSFTANCSVDATSGALTVNGPASFPGPAALSMGAKSVVQFLGDVTFSGGTHSIAGGVMEISGNFTQSAPAVFAPAPATQMVFVGTGAETITLSGSQSSLPNLLIQNSAGVTLNPIIGSVIQVTNTIVLEPNARFTLAPSTTATISVPVGAVAIPALNLFAGSVLTLNSTSVLRFGVPTPGCILHQGPPAATIVVPQGGVISTQQCTLATP